MMKSRLVTAASLLAGSVIFAASASAGCGNGIYCTKTHNTNAAHSWGLTTDLSSPMGSGYSMLRQVNPISHSGAHTVSTRYSAAPIAIADQPAVQYASSGSSYSFASSSAATPASMPGMGLNENLVRVDCPVTVDAPAGSRVLDCYTIQKTQYIQPAPVTRAYQVVRPVIAVPYPVPVMVPNTCGPIYDAPSRYGSSYGYGRCGQ